MLFPQVTIECIGILVCLKRRPHRKNKYKCNPSKSQEEVDLEPLKSSETANGDVAPSRMTPTVMCVRSIPDSPGPNIGSETSALGTVALQGIERHMMEVKNIIHKMESRMEGRLSASKDIQDSQNEWKYVALILDRFFFLIYVLLIVVSLCTMFPTVV